MTLFCTISFWKYATARGHLTLNFREKFRVSPRTILENFLSGGYPNRSSGIHRWGWDLSPGYPNTYFSWLSGYPQLTLVFLVGAEKFSDIFLRCLSRKSGSQHQLRIKTLPSIQHCSSCIGLGRSCGQSRRSLMLLLAHMCLRGSEGLWSGRKRMHTKGVMQQHAS